MSATVSTSRNQIDPVIDSVRNYCRRHDLLPRDATVLVAVSGGADSLTVLHVLLQLRDEFGITLHVATFDHMIRIPAGAEDAEFVRQLATEWGIPVTVGMADVPKLAKHATYHNLEAVARHARYTFLAQTAKSIGATHIATGHNRNDQEETVLMHLLRGAGTAGLRGMLPKTPSYVDKNLTLIRPLLEVPRARIDSYVEALGIIPREDDTNEDSQYMRNYLRREVMPILTKLTGASGLAKTTELIRDDYDALQSITPPAIVKGNSVSIERASFLVLHIAIKRMWVREAIFALVPHAEIDFTLTQLLVDYIGNHVANRYRIDDPRASIGNGLWIDCTMNTIMIQHGELPYPADCPQLTVDQTLTITGVGTYPVSTGWQITIERTDTYTPLFHPLTFILAVPPNAEIVIRTRRDGDRFKPYGMRGKSRKLQDMLVDQKVPQQWRDQVPLIVIDGEIAAIIAPTESGMIARVSETFAVREENERKVWLLRWESISNA